MQDWFQDTSTETETDTDTERSGETETGTRMQGTVLWFNDAKGFGFIQPEDGSQDCFVHHSDIQAQGFRSLSEGEKVEFERVENPKGPAAENVTKVE